MAALKKRYYQKIDEEVYSAILDNGMSLSIIKKKGFLEKAAFLSTNFGALDNHFYIDGELQSYPAGIAHFLEHKLFEDEQGRDVTLDFVKLGADVNAFTTLDKTTYYFSTLDHFEESLELLARPNRGKAYYHPIVIAKKDSNINNIEDLKSQSFAFVDTYSYSGYLAMNDYLKKNGVSANKFFSNSYFTHSHEESINQVTNGTVKAAIVDDWALQYIYNNFPDTALNIKIIKTFPEVATGPVVTHKNYEEKDKLKQILLSIDKDSAIKGTLSQLQIEKYEETKASDYPNLISED